MHCSAKPRSGHPYTMDLITFVEANLVYCSSQRWSGLVARMPFAATDLPGSADSKARIKTYVSRIYITRADRLLAGAREQAWLRIGALVLES